MRQPSLPPFPKVLLIRLYWARSYLGVNQKLTAENPQNPDAGCRSYLPAGPGQKSVRKTG